jgi:tetratricopeptide (TPR) repeat protein
LSQLPPQTVINSMVACYQNGQHEMARDIAQSIIKQFPDHCLSWKVLGAVFGQARQMEEALIANQNAVRLEPEDAELHNNLANVLINIGSIEEAEASYRKALELKPDYTEAHYNLGNMLQDLGRLDGAEASYRQAISINKDFSKARERVGNVLLKKGEHAEGLQFLRLACGSIFFNSKNGLSLRSEI